jgi:hypothetical protein
MIPTGFANIHKDLQSVANVLKADVLLNHLGGNKLWLGTWGICDFVHIRSVATVKMGFRTAKRAIGDVKISVCNFIPASKHHDW